MSERRPQRVAYLVSHPIQYQAPLLRRLAAREEVDLTVVFLSDFSAGEHFDEGFGEAFSWDVPLLEGYQSVVLSKEPRVDFWHPFLPSIARFLREGRFDVLWVHGWNQASQLLAIRAAHRLGMRVLLRGESKPEQRSSLRRLALRRVLRRASGYLSIGAENQRFYEENGVGAGEIYSMPYAVDNEYFRRRSEEASSGREALRAELGLEPGRPVILFAAKLIERKRPLDLLAAYRQLSLAGEEPQPYLLFAGSGPQSEELARAVADTGWNSVRLLGFRNQSELPGLYDLCDVFVLPSVYETWGLVLNEAMNAARPVIATRGVGAAHDLIEEGVTGHVVPPGDPASLAEALRRTLADPEHAREMGRCALERVSSFGLDACCDGFVAALEGVRAA